MTGRSWASSRPCAQPAPAPAPIAAPEPGDRRFHAAEWKSLPYFDYIKQAYLINAQWLTELVETTELADPAKKKLRFFTRQLIDATAPHATAFKMNIAYFEALGSEGMRLAEYVRRQVPADIPLIVDAKRGDIGATVTAQGVALFDVLGADAVTANPYLGIGALAPLLDRVDRFTYLLCRTSNPESGELQELRVGASASDPEETLAERVARLVGRRAEGSRRPWR